MQIFAHVDVLTQTRLEIKCAAEKDFYDSFISLKQAFQLNQITHVFIDAPNFKSLFESCK